MGEHVWAAYVFTDVVGSTRLWADHTEAMEMDLARHDEIVQSAAVAYGGVECSTAGDSFGLVFPDRASAVSAAVAIQRALAHGTWTVPGGIRVRIGIHVGTAQRRSRGWYGPPLNEAARIMSVAHGGQIVVSGSVADMLPDDQVTDLGSHQLRDIDGERHLFQIRAHGLETGFPPLRSQRRQLSTLPAQRTTLIGRDVDVDKVRSVLDRHRLITVVGAGGVGKTRAAIEAAGRAAERFPSGIFFVDLAAVTDDAGVPGAFIDGIGRASPPERSAPDHLVVELADRHALLVVDNCEHVVDAVAELLDQLLTHAPLLHALATSREPLGLAGERVVDLLPLEADGPDSPAVQLFVERAVDAGCTAAFGGAELNTVVEIVTRLDGVPLAIELAAARARTMSPDRILSHLDDRFRLLTGRRGGDPRQRTLETAIAWSYDLLEPDEQRALRALAVCAGPTNLTTAARLLGLDAPAASDRLGALAVKSLVVPIEAGGQVHGYRLLETIRAFGRDRLLELGDLDRARLALEAALLPGLDEGDEDLLAFVNSQANWTAGTLLEASTRAAAATEAMLHGRPDRAAFLIVAATTPSDPGGHGRLLASATRLVDRSDHLPEPAAVAARAGKMVLETFTNRYLDSFSTAAGAVKMLDSADPRRRLFDGWRLMISSTAIFAEVAQETDRLLPLAIEQATPPHDVATTMMATARAVSLYLETGRGEDARAAGRLATTWAEPGTAMHSLAISCLAWIEYLEHLEPGPEQREALEAGTVDNGMPDLAIAATLADNAPVADRARRLLHLARRRPLGRWMHEESTYLVPFAWLAIEGGDIERAGLLIEASATVELGTATGLIKAIQRVEKERTGTAADLHDIAPRLLARDVHALRRAPEVLAAELDRWSAVAHDVDSRTERPEANWPPSPPPRPEPALSCDD